jgi:hypothetical protein
VLKKKEEKIIPSCVLIVSLCRLAGGKNKNDDPNAATSSSAALRS